MPSASRFSQVSAWGNLGKWKPATSVGSACYLWQTARREFACCTSLGECLTTHMGVAAPVFEKPCGGDSLGK